MEIYITNQYLVIGPQVNNHLRELMSTYICLVETTGQLKMQIIQQVRCSKFILVKNAYQYINISVLTRNNN
jgi:hypothetical protein